ncbi:MAG TPA: hypothetical protein VHF88_09665 [Thermoleophilaceae bacterium]|nr:hypothetical protein [Thermoleophilaceae bacterium]
MTSRLRICRRLHTEQDGVAIVVAIGALGVLLILSTVAFSASSQLSDTSKVDRSARSAFQAAEAGLDVATYRINNLLPLGGGAGCVAGVEDATADGSCVAGEQLADGASWSYEVTPDLDEENYDELLPGGRCAGFPIQFDADDLDLTLRSRCITATGTAHGQTRRVQARLALFTGTSSETPGTTLFPVGGIIGLDGVTLSNAAQVSGSVASNGQVELSNAARVTGAAILGPGAPAPDVGNAATIGQGTVYRSPAEGPWVLAPVDIGNTATVNRNGNGIGWTVESGTATYSSAYRELEIKNAARLNFSGGDYNLCRLEAKNATRFTVTPGAKVRLFIDSPTRPGSGCRPGTGTFVAKNAFDLEADEKSAQFQIYIYGGDVDGNPAFEVKNSSGFHALLHAPLASVEFKNAASFWGAINAKRVEFGNASSFHWPAEGISGLTPDTDTPQNTLTLFQRSAWRECRSAPSDPENPHSGC